MDVTDTTTRTIDELIAVTATQRYPFPTAVVEELIARREDAVGPLIAQVEQAAANPKGIADSDDSAALFAVFLLAQFRESRAYAPMCRLFSLPKDGAFEVIGGAVTENGGALLASVCDGDIAPLCTIVEDASVDQFQRSAALRALKVLFLEGDLPREELRAYVQSLFRKRLERDYSYVWDSAVATVADCGLHECRENVNSAFAAGLASPSSATHDDIMKLLDKTTDMSPEQLKGITFNRNDHYITDTVAQLSTWYCFSREAHVARQRANAPKSDEQRVAPVPTTPKIGRNQPCPCGSGRKYKKCCGKGRA